MHHVSLWDNLAVGAVSAGHGIFPCGSRMAIWGKRTELSPPSMFRERAFFSLFVCLLTA